VDKETVVLKYCSGNLGGTE